MVNERHTHPEKLAVRLVFLAYQAICEKSVSEGFDIDQTFSLLSNGQVSVWFGVPTMFIMMQDHPLWEETDFSHIKLMISGGAPCPLPVFEKFWDKNVDFKTGYGLTEAVPNTFWLPPEDVRRKPGSVGFPLFHNDVRVIRPDGIECELEEMGELVIRGPHVCGGYWNNAKATNAATHSLSSDPNGRNWLHTSHLAKFDGEGYFFIVDRKKDMFVSGGENVNPAEIEAVLYPHPDIHQCAVVGVPNTKWCEAGLACVVLKPGASVREGELIDYMNQRLAGYKVPKRVEFLKEMPICGFRGIAIDLRGYGDTEDIPIDATHGLGDWVEDVLGFVATLKLGKYHVIGHSLGGALVFNLIAADAANILSATLAAPGSPFGFGGGKDEQGTPCYPDYAGSGSGIVNPDFQRLIGEGDRSSDNPQASPRVVMNNFYWKPPFIPEREEELLSSLMTEKIGTERYPGDFVPSENWPNVAPGKWGPINAVSPKYVGDSADRFLVVDPKPSILWVYGDSDQIVGDHSLFDFGTLGQLELVPGWPGPDIYSPQPTLKQTRFVLGKYQDAGGSHHEVFIPDSGHCPYIEKPDQFMEVFADFLKR